MIPGPNAPLEMGRVRQGRMLRFLLLCDEHAAAQAPVSAANECLIPPPAHANWRSAPLRHPWRHPRTAGRGRRGRGAPGATAAPRGPRCWPASPTDLESGAAPAAPAAKHLGAPRRHPHHQRAGAGGSSLDWTRSPGPGTSARSLQGTQTGSLRGTCVHRCAAGCAPPEAVPKALAARCCARCCCRRCEACEPDVRFERPPRQPSGPVTQKCGRPRPYE
jgi:hypothetical protein